MWNRSGGRVEIAQRFLNGVQYTIDFAAAILLLTGKISVTGIFVVPEGFYLSLTGPVFGGVTLSGKNLSTEILVQAIDKVVALLLILNVIRITGPYVTSGRFFLVVSGEIFGIKEIAGAVPLTAMNQNRATELSSVIRDTIISNMKSSGRGTR